MLFGYPVAATQNNWLHDCMVETVRNVHAAVDAGKRYPGWPKVLPKGYRTKLKLRTGLRDRLKAYNRAVRKLSEDDRNRVLRAVEAENCISDLLSGVSDCDTMDSLPSVVRDPVDDLFGFAFGLLDDFDVRDQHYAAIYEAAPEHMCPFCGTEYFDAPGAAREALDHYLTRSRYPFAAANLRNLVPMGHKCNSSYKLATDIIRRPDGSRRVACDPYAHTRISVSLDGSDPFDGTTPNTPRWDISFDPNSPAVGTWDEVFSVRVRYQRDHLDASFPAWLNLFRDIARASNVRAGSDAELIGVLKRLEDGFTSEGLQDRAFLKAAVFRMLRLRCEAGHARLLDLLRNLVAPLAPVSVGVGTAVP